MSEPVVDFVLVVAHGMRARGADPGPTRVMTAHRALAAVDPASRRQGFLAMRAALCSVREEIPLYEEAFADAVADRRLPLPAALPASRASDLARAAGGHDDYGVGYHDAGAVIDMGAIVHVEQAIECELESFPRASLAEALRDKDFAELSAEERAVLNRLIARMRVSLPRRHSRRTSGTRRRHGELDLRRTLRSALRTQREPVVRHWRRPRRVARDVVLLCDVSGSMAAYSDVLMRFLHACLRSGGKVEAFTFGTRLTRVTESLRAPDPDVAMHRVAGEVPDWSGGTRIGAALRELNRSHRHRLARGTVAVIVSDGLDCGDPGAVSSELAVVRRAVHSLIWINPLKGQPGYAPEARGMRAALPSVDHFLAANSLRSLEDLGHLLRGIGT